MALNFESAQLVIGAAIVDRRFARTLLHDRGRALRLVEQFPGAPGDVHLSDEDRLLLGSIRAGSLQQFARGVERLCSGLQPLPEQAPAPTTADDLALSVEADPVERGGRQWHAPLTLLAPLPPLEAG